MSYSFFTDLLYRKETETSAVLVIIIYEITLRLFQYENYVLDYYNKFNRVECKCFQVSGFMGDLFFAFFRARAQFPVECSI